MSVMSCAASGSKTKPWPSFIAACASLVRLRRVDADFQILTDVRRAWLRRVGMSMLLDGHPEVGGLSTSLASAGGQRDS